MNDLVLERFRMRAHDTQTRVAVRSWNYRQRNLAAGVWFQVRRALAHARAAYAIPDEDAGRLIVEGHEPLPCGRRLAPEKTILFVDEARLAAVSGRRAIPVGLGPEFFTASAVALVPFDGANASSRPSPAER
jgi:hypothetical protein